MVMFAIVFRRGLRIGFAEFKVHASLYALRRFPFLLKRLLLTMQKDTNI